MAKAELLTARLATRLCSPHGPFDVVRERPGLRGSQEARRSRSDENTWPQTQVFHRPEFVAIDNESGNELDGLSSVYRIPPWRVASVDMGSPCPIASDSSGSLGHRSLKLRMT